MDQKINYLIAGLICICFLGCGDQHKLMDQTSADDRPLTSYVNPFIGTGGHGHTYPGATLPFGMVQLSPDTRLEGWDGCSGYHYSDERIYGFSHTHLSGTGVIDYGDILLMPTDSAYTNNGADGNPGYASRFSHNKELASPGYYQVHLEDSQIDVRLTTTERAGIHEYRFPSRDHQYVILDLAHRDELTDYEMNLESSTTISGKRFSKAWATDQRLFFYIKLSHPIRNNAADSADQVYPLQLDNPLNEPVVIKVGISAVDIAGAKRNLESEIGERSFEQIKAAATTTWENQLSKIQVEDSSKEYKINFYTALYHSMLAPNLYQDVDGRYRGMDMNIHKATDHRYYTVFSMWDTYRAAHPLYTIIERERSNDFIQTMVDKYEEGGILPIWDLSANYTGCMIGYHGVPIIADAYLKGISQYDEEKAFEAMKHSASQDHLGLRSYKQMGYIPVEMESESVSKTLEYAYDDWTIAQMAKAMGKQEEYKQYVQRAQNYKNLYNPSTGFLQGRYCNTWFAPFQPEEVNFNYTEANAWQYSLYAPQDINGHIDFMGGPMTYENHLDNLFAAPMQTSGRHQADITGLIGQYAHGNEPSHHMAYLYNYVGKPHKTQEKVHQIMTSLYQNSPDGISGNEDCGQMSAWYIFSALGFYPVTPASNTYIIGTPLFDKVTMNLENGKQVKIIKKGEGIYVAGMKYKSAGATDFQPINTSYISHDLLTQSGTIQFNMSTSPTNWAQSIAGRPTSRISEHLITTSPYIKNGDISFSSSTQIVLESHQADAQIFYAFDDTGFQPYVQPLEISEAKNLHTYAQRGTQKSPVITTKFYKYDKNKSIVVESTFANEYSAGGNNALIDGMKGTKDFRSGSWQGTQKEDVVVTVDLGSSKNISSINTSFLKDQRSWIFYPKKVTFRLLDQNKKEVKQITRTLPETGQLEISDIYDLSIDVHADNIRYVTMHAQNYGKLPDWHLGHPYDGDAWIFVDEISIE
ncbi:GH92 family glycosyl hydrolase [Nonlabens xiamenensis]|uniref:GH92 family glycosyl hydrolase n=1 Tax=Nonlabens xiamenensis TaxID=2341043 RepID=UPI001F0CD5A9|nr:GH92 family glycosyl hydrolase [Nonlabens xiamenensis]